MVMGLTLDQMIRLASRADWIKTNSESDRASYSTGIIELPNGDYAVIEVGVRYHPTFPMCSPVSKNFIRIYTKNYSYVCSEDANLSNSIETVWEQSKYALQTRSQRTTESQSRQERKTLLNLLRRKQNDRTTPAVRNSSSGRSLYSL